MNSPGIPGQNSIGRNAHSVVAVDEIIDQNVRLPLSVWAPSGQPICQRLVRIFDHHNGTVNEHPNGKDQAEHDDAAHSILITHDADFADAVEAAVQAMLPQLERAAVASQSWADNGAIITVPSMNEMPALANQIAAEHLELALDDAVGWSGKIRHAGAMFLGRYTPEAIGDYVAGPNHVLPTARTARFSSGLGVADFMKRTTIVACGADGFSAIAPSGVTLADAEGLGAHALSMRIRMNR